MMKSVTGQYECVHRSGLGLDYFTSRVDRLTLQPNGRFMFIVQDRSRIAHAAQSLASGQQVSSAAPEVRREGTYLAQGTSVSLRFDDGTQQYGQLVPASEGSSNNLQLEQDVFTKVSDSTLLPSAGRLKKDMEDIAKGLKIAGAIGGVAIKAAKTIHDTIQSTQASQASTATQMPAPTQNAGTQVPPVQPYSTQQAVPTQVPPVQPYTASSPSYQPSPVSSQQAPQTVYCDQCGTKARPGKRFCSKCGASLF
ncbi:MAG: hypothetical protein NVS4B12_03910 [Ktedonobacteraceae bacterium]